MTEYWVRIDYGVRSVPTDWRGLDLEPTRPLFFDGYPILGAGQAPEEGHGYAVVVSGSVPETNFFRGLVRHGYAMDGGILIHNTGQAPYPAGFIIITDPNGSPLHTGWGTFELAGYEYIYLDQHIGASFVVGTAPDPTSVIGPEVELGAFRDDFWGFTTSVHTLAYYWVRISVPDDQPPDRVPVAESELVSAPAGSDFISGQAHATDADGDPLTYEVVTPPAHGSFSFEPDGSFIYTPVNDFTGPDSFTFVANDGMVDSNIATITLGFDDPAEVNLRTLAAASLASYGVAPPPWGFHMLPGAETFFGLFRVVAYANSDTSEIILAVRGSNSFANAITDLLTWWKDAPTPGFRSIVEAASDLLFTLGVDYPSSHITLTGHSLGGAVAQIVGLASGYATHVFNAPGASDLYGHLTNELIGARLAAGHNPTPHENANYRMPHDVVSLFGEAIGQVYTILVSGDLPAFTPLVGVLNAHSLEAVITALGRASVVLDDAVDIPPEMLALTTLIQVAEAVSTTENRVVRAFSSLAEPDAPAIGDGVHAASAWYDPGPGDAMIFSVEDGSPPITSVSLVANPEVGWFEVSSWEDGAWTAPQTLTPGYLGHETAEFGAGVRAFRVEARSWTGDLVSAPNGFLFNATFASAGLVDATATTYVGDGGQLFTDGADVRDFNLLHPWDFVGGEIGQALGGADIIHLPAGVSGADPVDHRAEWGFGPDTVFSGGDGDDQVFGADADDRIDGDSGNDLLNGGPGADRLGGGAGADTASYATSASAVFINLATGSIAGGEAAGDSYVSIESVTGSAHNDDLRGDGQANTLTGGGGNDNLFGQAGADALLGGDGDDYIYLDEADLSGGQVLGGPGYDWVLNYTSGPLSPMLVVSMAALGIEGYYGSGGNETISAAGITTSVTIYANLGADVITGGSGNDYLYTTHETASVQGGAGYDYAIFNENGVGTSLNLATSGIEGAVGRNGADVLNGAACTVSVSLYGNDGADQLLGGAGNDYLYFDEADVATGVLSGGAGYDYLLNYTFTTPSALLTVNMAALGAEGYQGNAGAERVDASGCLTSVSLYGEGGADQLIGGAGDDYIYFDLADLGVGGQLAGGAGYDYAIYNVASGNAVLELASRGFEGAVGRGGNDSFDASGNTTSVSLYGYGGNDVLKGGAATDYLYGDVGNDTLTGGGGADYFITYAGWGSDTVTDFQNGLDRTAFNVAGLSSFAQLVISQDGADALASYSGNSIRFLDTLVAELDASDFLF